MGRIGKVIWFVGTIAIGFVLAYWVFPIPLSDIYIYGDVQGSFTTLGQAPVSPVIKYFNWFVFGSIVTLSFLIYLLLPLGSNRRQ